MPGAPWAAAAPLAIVLAGETPTATKRGVWPLWKLCLVAGPQLTVQVFCCHVRPSSTPYMLRLGAGPALAAFCASAGPAAGFLAGPLVGAVSDSLTSPHGRRRPVVLVGLASTWVAGMLLASAERLLPKGQAALLAAPACLLLDAAAGVLQTPHRALVADLASDEQQIPMQAVLVLLMAAGNLVGFSIMQVFEVAAEHMLELMLLVCGLNTAAVAVQFAVAKEMPLARDPSNTGGGSACAPLAVAAKAAKDSPRLLYHLGAVQSLVWIGLATWSACARQWLGTSVHGGDEAAPEGSLARDAFARGEQQFMYGGQCKAALQLVSSLAVVVLLMRASVPPRLVYAPCVFGGAVASLLAASLVQQNGLLALACMALSVLPEVGSFVPFGLVAVLNKRAEQEGKQVSTAFQMALLTCCATLGQQICATSLSAAEGRLSLEQTLPMMFLAAAAAQTLGGAGALLLNDRVEEDKAADWELVAD